MITDFNYLAKTLMRPFLLTMLAIPMSAVQGQEVMNAKVTIGTASHASREVIGKPSVTFEDIFPNPFEDATSISYALAKAGHVTIALYDLRGNEVRHLADGVMAEGPHQLTIARDALASGNYLLRISTEQGSRARMITVE